MNSRRVWIRRAVIALAVIFWLAVIAISMLSLYSIFVLKDKPIVALHHLSVGVILLTISVLGVYAEISRASALRSRRRYCLEYQLSSFVYLVTAGFIVDPLPVNEASEAVEFKTFFTINAGLGLVIAIMKCILGCANPDRSSVALSSDAYEMASGHRQLDDSGPSFYTPRQGANDSQDAPRPSRLSQYASSSRCRMDRSASRKESIFPDPQMLNQDLLPRHNGEQNPFPKEEISSCVPTAEKVSKHDASAMCRQDTNPFSDDIECGKADNPFDPET